MRELTFTAKILVQSHDADEPLTITHTVRLLKEGKMDVRLPQFMNEPTIILVEKEESKRLTTLPGMFDNHED